MDKLEGAEGPRPIGPIAGEASTGRTGLNPGEDGMGMLPWVGVGMLTLDLLCGTGGLAGADGLAGA